MTQDRDEIHTQLQEINERLEALEEDFDLLRTIQTANRRETRGNSQTISRLERTVGELANISRQQQITINRIIEYLFNQTGNDNGRTE